MIHQVFVSGICFEMATCLSQLPIESPSVKILLIENDDVDAERVVRIVGECPDSVVEHERSLAKAIPLLIHRTIDVVLLDLGLSDCDCLEAISALSDISSAPIVVLSGAPEETARPLTLQRGAFDFLSKSIDLETQLPMTLEAALLNQISCCEN